MLAVDLAFEEMDNVNWSMFGRMHKLYLRILNSFYLFCLLVCLRLYVRVNNFSVILGQLPGFNQY